MLPGRPDPRLRRPRRNPQARRQGRAARGPVAIGGTRWRSGLRRAGAPASRPTDPRHRAGPGGCRAPHAAGARARSRDCGGGAAAGGHRRHRRRGSKARRAVELATLFSLADADEQQFLARLLLGELRQGALDGAGGRRPRPAFELPVASVRRAWMLRGDIAEVATIARRDGRAGLEAVQLRLFRPVLPMLAQPADDLDDALARCRSRSWSTSSTALGCRCTSAATRCASSAARATTVTAAVPELVAAVATLPARELVLDGETLALTPTAVRCRFRPPCAASAGHSDDAAARTSCRCRCSASTAWRWTARP
jgi:hypothetical protein